MNMNFNIETFTRYFPVLLPLILADLALAVGALIHLLRHPRCRFGNKFIWILVILLIQLFGPIVYFLFGKGEEE